MIEWTEAALDLWSLRAPLNKIGKKEVMVHHYQKREENPVLSQENGRVCFRMSKNVQMLEKGYSRKN